MAFPGKYQDSRVTWCQAKVLAQVGYACEKVDVYLFKRRSGSIISIKDYSLNYEHTNEEVSAQLPDLRVKEEHYSM